MKKQRINHNWTFWKDGRESQAQTVDLPHDAMILEARIPELENGNAAGFFPGGKYIYIKKIYGEVDYAETSVMIEFEGVYMNSEVYLNGEKIGGWIYGYTNFYVDLTGRLKIGEENELKVIVDNSRTPNSRWYSGSGIYRPVNLWTGGKMYGRENSSNSDPGRTEGGLRGSIAWIRPEGVKVKTVSINPSVIEVSVEAVAGEGTEVACTILRDGEMITEGVNIILKDCKRMTDPTVRSTPLQAGGDYTGEMKRGQIMIEIPDARLWSSEEPNLYTIKTVLKQHSQILDEAEDSFGIRTLAWDAEKGFQVNGKSVKLRGGCIHHDHGILGACAYDKAEYRRVKKLKELGFNALRYSHNPAGKNFLKACDELGMYVLDETFDQWKLPQSTYDYAMHFEEEWRKDVGALVSKDYNHPCVIMYCIGNEITDTGLPFGTPIARMLSETFHSLDDTRATTIANNAMLSTMAALQAKKKAETKPSRQKEAEAETAQGNAQRPARQKETSEEKTVGSSDVNDIVTLLPKIMASITPESIEELAGGCFEAVDIVGYNYGQNLYEGTHERKPERVILSSETFPRTMASNWEMVEQHEYVIGDFLWTAWDYLGEAGVGQPVYGTTQAPFSKAYPCLTAACGSVDLTGYPEAQAYYNAVLWGAYSKPYIGVRPVDHSGEEYTLGRWRLTDALNSWTWNGCEGRKAEIEVYSIGDSVELIQDGVPLGRKRLERCRADFETEYRPGKLEAVSFADDGSEIARTSLETAGEENCLAILPEEMRIKADGEDIVFVPVHVTDENGRVKMMTDRKITVTVDGPGRLLAVGSGRPETEECFSDGSYTSWHGRVLAVVKSTKEAGIIKVTAAAEGMEAVTAEIYSG